MDFAVVILKQALQIQKIQHKSNLKEVQTYLSIEIYIMTKDNINFIFKWPCEDKSNETINQMQL